MRISESEIIFECVEKMYQKSVDPFTDALKMKVKYTANKHNAFINVGNNVYAIDLINEAFLKEHKIDYIKEDNKIIPVGIVTFLNEYIQDCKYSQASIKIILLDSNNNNLMCDNQIALKNIERAIELRIDEYKVVKKCNIEY